MKRLTKLVLILIMAFILIGCGKDNDDEPKEEVLESDTVILENIKYKLDQDDNEYGINYKIASNFRKTDMGNAINYFSENINDQPYFVIRMFYYKNKTIDYAINDTTESYDKKFEEKVNDLDYTVVHFINYTGADVNIYYHQNNNDVYAFCFTAGIDITRLKDIFLSSIVYE